MAAQIADEMAERTHAVQTAPVDGDEFQPHLTNAAPPRLGPSKPKAAPPKPFQRVRGFDDIN